MAQGRSAGNGRTEQDRQLTMNINGYSFDIGDIIKYAVAIIGVVVWWVTMEIKIGAHITVNQAQHEEIMLQHRQQLPVLRQICRNTAASEMAQQTCDRVEATP